MREPERKEQAAAQSSGQASFFTCPVCFDTGKVKINGTLKRCWCQEDF